MILELKPDHPFRFHSSRWVNEKFHDDVDFAKKKSSFWMKLIFTLMGTLMRKILAFGSQINPLLTLQKLRQPLRVHVWCDLWSGISISLYFFENEHKNTFTVNEDTYCTLIIDLFAPTFHVFDVNDNRIVQPATHLMPQSNYCFKR